MVRSVKIPLSSEMELRWRKAQLLLIKWRLGINPSISHPDADWWINQEISEIEKNLACRSGV